MKKIILSLLIGFALISIMTVAAYCQSNTSTFEVGLYISDGDTSIIRTKTQKIASYITLMKDGEIVYGDATWDILLVPKKGAQVADRIRTLRVYRLLDGSTYSIQKPTNSAIVRQIYTIIRARDDR